MVEIEVCMVRSASAAVAARGAEYQHSLTGSSALGLQVKLPSRCDLLAESCLRNSTSIDSPSVRAVSSRPEISKSFYKRGIVNSTIDHHCFRTMTLTHNEMDSKPAHMRTTTF